MWWLSGERVTLNVLGEVQRPGFMNICILFPLVGISLWARRSHVHSAVPTFSRSVRSVRCVEKRLVSLPLDDASVPVVVVSIWPNTPIAISVGPICRMLQLLFRKVCLCCVCVCCVCVCCVVCVVCVCCVLHVCVVCVWCVYVWAPVNECVGVCNVPDSPWMIN